MGGASKTQVLELLKKGVPVKPVSLDYGRQFIKVLDMSPAPDLAAHDSPPSTWTNMYRQDDFSAIALFYLNSPVDGLPKLAAVEKRTEVMLDIPPK